MKLLRYRLLGQDRPGCLDETAQLRDLGGHISDLAGDNLGVPALARLQQLDIEHLPLVSGDYRVLPPVVGTRNFLAVGLNYLDHAAETGLAIPTVPMIFNKAPSSISGPDDPIAVPFGASKVDWELELAIVIGTSIHQAGETEALAAVAGYCICNDVSERAWQFEGPGQWTKGKSAPGFGPLGPWLVTKDEVPDVLDLDMMLTVNGVVRQKSNTRNMIFSPAQIVAYISKHMRLEAGDVITTGTPAGVGMASETFLASGDMLTLTIERLGMQCQQIK
jgi:2,4-diketo-3-deoxy-L-fuconate hydrolase